MSGRSSGTLTPCRGCGRKIVFSEHVLCCKCVADAAERRYERARYYYKHTLTTTEESAWAGVGTSLSVAQDYAPVFSEVTGYDAKGEPK